VSETVEEKVGAMRIADNGNGVAQDIDASNFKRCGLLREKLRETASEKKRETLFWFSLGGAHRVSRIAFVKFECAARWFLCMYKIEHSWQIELNYSHTYLAGTKTMKIVWLTW
jgi:hypothetical protein